MTLMKLDCESMGGFSQIQKEPQPYAELGLGLTTVAAPAPATARLPCRLYIPLSLLAVYVSVIYSSLFVCSSSSHFPIEKLMATATLPSPVITSFNTARQEFLHDFSNSEYAKTFSEFASIDDVYNATDEIQKKQGESRMLRNLAKIQPCLECLNQYATVLNTAVQVKPEILALIWVRMSPSLHLSSMC